MDWMSDGIIRKRIRSGVLGLAELVNSPAEVAMYNRIHLILREAVSQSHPLLLDIDLHYVGEEDEREG